MNLIKGEYELKYVLKIPDIDEIVCDYCTVEIIDKPKETK